MQGDWVSEVEELRSMVCNLFMALCTDDCGAYLPFLLPVNRFPLLTAEELSALNKDFTSSEVKKVIFEMAPYKAPGLDGFQALFYQNN